MQFNIFTVSAGDAGALDELNRFLRGHRVLTVDRTWTGAAWAFCVAYQEGNVGASGGISAMSASWGRAAGTRVDYKSVLSAAEFARFSRLREMRKKAAQAENLPAYAIFTDAHLAAFSRLTPPVSRADLDKAEGVPAARLKRHAGDLLAVLGGAEEGMDLKGELQIEA